VGHSGGLRGPPQCGPCPCVRLNERRIVLLFAGFKQDSPGCFRGPSGLSPTDGRACGMRFTPPATKGLGAGVAVLVSPLPSSSTPLSLIFGAVADGLGEKIPKAAAESGRCRRSVSYGAAPLGSGARERAAGMRCGGTRRPSVAANTAGGRRPWGRHGARVASPAPTARASSVRAGGGRKAGKGG
jgi:hypothetical protein